jgi:hypothetical protein
MKKTIFVFGMLIVVLAAIFVSACSRGGETSSNAVNKKDQSQQNSGTGQMMNSPDMMRQMMKDPEMMRQMMVDMMKNPDMMREMMTNPKMVEMMTRYMNEHASEMNAHMEIMMKDAEHRRAMVEMMRRNPAMREQMRAIISEAEKPTASQTGK